VAAAHVCLLGRSVRRGLAGKKALNWYYLLLEARFDYVLELLGKFSRMRLSGEHMTSRAGAHVSITAKFQAK
jgi:hypothetical protein